MSRLVVVSNRMAPARGEPSAGGLALALQATLRHCGGLWLGWSGDVRAAPAARPRLRSDGFVSYAELDFSPADYRDYYLGFCNAVLWPLCHDTGEALPDDAALYQSYLRVNQQYAQSLLPLLRSDDLMWVHDYHLLPLAKMLRKAGAAQALGLFLHVPFPRLHALQVLPAASELLDALLAYDVLGFQTFADLEEFHRAAVWRWGEAAVRDHGELSMHGRRIRLGVFPIGVDVDAIRHETGTVQQHPLLIEALTKRRGGTLLVAADRLTNSKGLLERCDAIDAYLRMPQASAHRPCLLQVAAPSRMDLPQHPELKAALKARCAAINGRHSRAYDMPLRLLTECVAHDVLMGLLGAAHVGLVTPLRDGMNLVGKEFVAAQDPADPGVLVLSKFAGAARELKNALLVDPRDVAATAEALCQAVTMTLPERLTRHQENLAALRRNDLHAWHSGFIDQLSAVRDSQLDDLRQRAVR